MIKKISYLLLFGQLLALIVSCKNDSIELSRGIVITKSGKVTAKDILLPSYDSLNRGVIEISGNNIVVDFNNAVIRGNDSNSAPHAFTGVGVYIRDGKNITIKNLNIRGFKIGLYAENVENLKIENSDFSYNYRPRLHSIREKEDITDWLSYHDNENDQWKRFGSGIYLKNCRKAILRSNKASENQNALLMTLCDSAQVYNNVFDFNSGLGIGLYRSSHNQILHNVLDFNIRGYSHGFYNRGQDSAGILVYEQSSFNNFAFNSATHSGDGFFLWAGNETMESGEGGCNDNLIYDNDFSYAPTNGIEVTFSSNLIFQNKLHECRYGIWGGYSYNTVIYGNDIARNDYGIAIEHGNTNAIVKNSFDGDSIAIQLWQRDVQPSGWGFAEKRDVSSHNYILAQNSFDGVHTLKDIRNTSNIRQLDSFAYAPQFPAELEDGLDAKAYHPYEGRQFMKINEWGPYNYRYPLIWLEAIHGDEYVFSVYCPGGNCEISKMEGFLESTKSEFQETDTIVFKRDPSKELLVVQAIYTGPEFRDQFGEPQGGSNPYPFRFSRFEHAMNWSVNFYNYDPKDTLSLYKEDIPVFLGSTRPVFSEKKANLDYRWWRAPHPGVKDESFITIAEASSRFEPGDYFIKLTSDDGVRMFLDGELLINNWNIHEASLDTITVPLNGEHHFRIEHFEGGGFATLDFKINPVPGDPDEM